MATGQQRPRAHREADPMKHKKPAKGGLIMQLWSWG
jgi:hypothetical protein